MVPSWRPDQTFQLVSKNSKEWAKRRERGSMHWERDSPCLALQWVDNKVVSVLTTIDNANDYGQINRKCKTAGVWSSKVVSQPKAISRNYNKYMNGVDRSNQILATNNYVNHESMRWWKTLFFHLIDIAVVNPFILIKKHQAKFTYNADIHSQELEVLTIALDPVLSLIIL